LAPNVASAASSSTYFTFLQWQLCVLFVCISFFYGGVLMLTLYSLRYILYFFSISRYFSSSVVSSPDQSANSAVASIAIEEKGPR
jgi:hypothetical protein